MGRVPAVRRTLIRSGLGAVLAACASMGSAQQATSITTQPAELRLGIERITLPGSEHLGLVGGTYLLGLGHGIAFGPGAYGAISGQRGGLFVVGAELAWQHRLSGPLVLDAGFYFGGGGGGSAPVGGGLMLRPHVDLLWDFGPFMAGVSASQVRFANGSIDSRQLGVVWAWKSEFRALQPGGAATDASANASGIGIDRIDTFVASYRPRASAKRLNGAALDGAIGLVGMRLERRLSDHVFAGLEAAGAASGGVAGYAEALATLGTETTVGSDALGSNAVGHDALGHDALRIGARVALGMGGGGRIDVGGGLLLSTELYGQWRIAPGLSVGLGAGLTRAPQGSFGATRWSASLDWDLSGAAQPLGGDGAASAVRTDWVGGAERYRARRTDGSTRSLDAVILGANRFITPQVYLSGQVHSGFAGDAGGYTVGLLGVGAQGNIWRAVGAGAELLVGAAGGGGVNTSGGAVMQPSIYLNAAVSPQLALRVSAGRIKALRHGGTLDATTLGASLVYSYGVSGS